MKGQFTFLLVAISPLIGPSAANCFGTTAIPKAGFSRGNKVPTQLQIRIWIDQLGDNSFRVRENAMKKIKSAGPAAVESLAESIAKASDLETFLRVEQLLESFWKTKDIVLKSRLKFAFKKLAKSKNKRVADWAEAFVIETMNKTFAGMLSQNSPPDRIRRGHPHNVHTMKMVKGATYTIDMVGRFDTYLRLENSRQANLRMDDDGGNGLNSRIVFVPSYTDNYRIIATCFSRSRLGSYTVTVRCKGR